MYLQYSYLDPLGIGNRRNILCIWVLGPRSYQESLRDVLRVFCPAGVGMDIGCYIYIYIYGYYVLATAKVLIQDPCALALPEMLTVACMAPSVQVPSFVKSTLWFSVRNYFCLAQLSTTHLLGGS